MFFERLQEELEKVNRFYLEKEAEFVEHANGLVRQLNHLATLKVPSFFASILALLSAPCLLPWFRAADGLPWAA